MPKYKNIKVKLSGMDGNAFSIIGRVQKAMKVAGVASAEIDEFVKESMSGDYNNVIQTAMKFVKVA